MVNGFAVLIASRRGVETKKAHPKGVDPRLPSIEKKIQGYKDALISERE